MIFLHVAVILIFNESRYIHFIEIYSNLIQNTWKHKRNYKLGQSGHRLT